MREGGHRFRVNLQDYLDTGLFLDHRGTRALVGSLSAGRRVLNLFGYTGSFTVYAAAGGAKQTLTIDLVEHLCLDWTERNLRENGLDLSRHHLLRADVLAWLREPPSTTADGERDGFDLIVLDPPTFSNSKRMRDTLDIVRDHPWLLSQVLQRLRLAGSSCLAATIAASRCAGMSFPKQTRCTSAICRPRRCRPTSTTKTALLLSHQPTLALDLNADADVDVLAT